MNILVDLIKQDQLMDGFDWRCETLIYMCHELSRRGHHIFYKTIGNVENKLQPFTKWTGQVFDHYIMHSPYNDPKKERLRLEVINDKKKVTVYDYGWLPKSIMFDRNKFFGEHYISDQLNFLVNNWEQYEFSKAEKYRTSLVTNNISKRQQKEKENIPNIDYIFIPGLPWSSFRNAIDSDTNLYDLIKTTVEWANTKHSLNVIYKPHPLCCHEDRCSIKEYNNYFKSIQNNYSNFHIINTSIYDLMNKAKFTVCINSSSIIDNIVTQTPVYCCGKSLFYKTEAVVYHSNVVRGLDRMYSNSFNFDKMKLFQHRLLGWMQKHDVMYNKTPKENVENLVFHSGISF